MREKNPLMKLNVFRNTATFLHQEINLNRIASFLWVEIGLSVYWPVSCGGNEFLGSILNLSSYISNKFSVFMLKLVHE